MGEKVRGGSKCVKRVGGKGIEIRSNFMRPRGRDFLSRFVTTLALEKTFALRAVSI